MLLKILESKKFRLSEKQEIIVRYKVANLPRQERIAIHCVFWKELSYMQTAQCLKISTSDVEKIVQNALILLRSDLQDIANNYFGVTTQEKELIKAA